MADEIENKKEGQDEVVEMTISTAEYKSLIAFKDENAILKEQLADMQKKLNRALVDASLSGSLAEAKTIAREMFALNNLLMFLGRREVDFITEDVENYRAFALDLIENLIKELEIDYVYGEGENLLNIITNIKKQYQLKMKLELETEKDKDEAVILMA